MSRHVARPLQNTTDPARGIGTGSGYDRRSDITLRKTVQAMRRLTRRQTGISIAVAALLGVVLCLTALMPFGGAHPLNEPASRIDTQPRACLAQDTSTSASVSSRAWAGLLQAAHTDHAIVIQRFAPPTGVAAGTFLNTVAQMRCTVIVTLGSELTRTAGSTHSPGIRFIGISAEAASGSIKSVPEADFTPESLSAEVLTALHGG